MTEHGVTETLASYCATATSEPLSPNVRDRLKQHLLDFDDTHRASSLHPGVVVDVVRDLDERNVDDLVAAVGTTSVDDPHAR